MADRLEARIATETALDTYSTRLAQARADPESSAHLLRQIGGSQEALISAVAGYKLARPQMTNTPIDATEMYAAAILLRAGARPGLVVRTIETLTRSYFR